MYIHGPLDCKMEPISAVSRLGLANLLWPMGPSKHDTGSESPEKHLNSGTCLYVAGNPITMGMHLCWAAG